MTTLDPFLTRSDITLSRLCAWGLYVIGVGKTVLTFNPVIAFHVFTLTETKLLRIPSECVWMVNVKESVNFVSLALVTLRFGKSYPGKSGCSLQLA